MVRICHFGYLLFVNSQGLLLRYCIPMDNDRPELNSKYFKQVCPDENGMLNCNGVNCG
jgi:hypothetical protein